MYLLYIIITFYLIYYLLNFNRYSLASKYYILAKNIAKKKNKKLIVIGDPCSGNFGFMNLIKLFLPKYYHGDITIDLFGCSKCDHVDINDIKSLQKYKTNKYVIFETGTLSFANDIKLILKEIKRISGGDFLSAGGTINIFWKLYLHKLYAKKYNSQINYCIYPFNFKNDKIYKVYNLKLNKYEYVNFNKI